MANHYATARSNYFAVKDEKAFREWAALVGLSVLEPDARHKATDGIRRFGIAPGDCSDSGTWPTSLYNEEFDEYNDLVVAEQLSVHLADDEVAVLMEVGNGKQRYLSGTAEAVNNRGESVYLNLDSIYESARELGPHLTRAEY